MFRLIQSPFMESSRVILPEHNMIVASQRAAPRYLHFSNGVSSPSGKYDTLSNERRRQEVCNGSRPGKPLPYWSQIFRRVEKRASCSVNNEGVIADHRPDSCVNVKLTCSKTNLSFSSNSLLYVLIKSR